MTNGYTASSIRSTCCAGVAIWLSVGAACIAPLWAAPSQSTADDASLIGLIGSEKVTESAVVQADEGAFDELRRGYETEQHQVEFKYAKARYDLLKRQLDERLDAAAVAREAAARGVSRESVLAGLKIEPLTEEQARAFYEENRDRIREPYEQVAAKMREYLTAQREQAAQRSFYDALRAKHGIKALLGPYRVAVAASGPSRGPASAPVTIIEFGDFQCPYCQRAESSLHAVLEQYPREVRLVFRNLPLTKIHPHAEAAAEAAVCAARQGKFWEMHDAMYAAQNALTPDALADTAKRLGLDLGEYSSCLHGGETGIALEADARAAQDLGLSGTPYFFINGRPLDGNVPLDKFQSVIAEELHAAADRG